MEKIALVTGCSSGIGMATSLKLAREGFYTFASMRNVSKGEHLKELAKSEKLPLEVIELDVSKPQNIDSVFEKIKTTKKRLDVLVNNAGFMIMGSFEDIPMEKFVSQLTTDFFGPVLMMKKAIPLMRSQEENNSGLRGNIINVSSIAGKIPFAYASAYISSKFAIEGISECIQDEVQDKGIKINIIEPGVVKTDFFKNTDTLISDNSPYRDIVELWTNTAKKLFEVTLNTSEDVAEKIFECIEDSESELRIPVGDDAEQFLEMHHEYSKDPQEFKKWLAEEMEKLFTATK
jgi:NAD(P)-dependent dehydrogenase (short-subunit alcohol dehydrogenase family)